MDDKSSAAIPSTTQETAGPMDTSDQPASKPLRDPSVSSTATAKRTQPKRTTSATNSPIVSRESSPARPLLKSNSTAPSTGPGRSRKNSYNDVSPSRAGSTSSNPPSAAAQQRTLSAIVTPALHPVSSDPTIKAPTPQKPPAPTELKDPPRWPISPRLRSPPPIHKPTAVSPRKTEQNSPAITVQRLTQSSEQPDGKPNSIDAEADDVLSISGTRSPARGFSGTNSTLETVQEISQPNTPARGSVRPAEKEENGVSNLEAEQDNPRENGSSKTNKAKLSNESGSDSGKGEGTLRPTAGPALATRPNAPAKAYTTTAVGTRGKPSGEGSTRNMTVETETVSSIPQVTVSVGSGGAGNNGGLRAKQSSETIRPKKEKKKSTRKTPSITSGTGELSYSSRPRLHHHHYTQDDAVDMPNARPLERQYSQGLYFPSESSCSTSPERSSSQAFRRPSLSIYNVGAMLTKARPASSKADIFEAKVASAVDEANSSDSEETFVYESNPPDTNDRPRRFHSRTPSATSMASQVDQRNGVRSIIDGAHSVMMKKSMKFANSYNSNPAEAVAGEDDGSGTVRSNIGTGRGTAHHHHIGRWGRNGANGHASLFDNESPFPNAAKSKLAPGNSTRNSPRQTSPRVPNGHTTVNGKKSSTAYDLDDGADDERTPLMSTVRSGRSGRNRRAAPPSIRQLEHQASRQNRPFLTWFAGCLVLSLMVILVISASLGFMFATTQPLADVKILALKDVLASEQDIIFDMKVTAKNPNIAVVTIDSTDLVIFAKSQYAGTDAEWWKRPQMRNLLRRGIRRREQDAFDPPLDGDPNNNPNLEIGRVYHLNSPLTFEGSPFKHSRSESTGQIRISHPGNHTIPAGSRRWGNVLQHEFDLIVRGTLKYTLPLSQKVRSISVEGRATVKPNAADEDPNAVHID
jgi:hypothetical protein